MKRASFVTSMAIQRGRVDLKSEIQIHMFIHLNEIVVKATMCSIKIKREWTFVHSIGNIRLFPSSCHFQHFNIKFHARTVRTSPPPPQKQNKTKENHDNKVGSKKENVIAFSFRSLSFFFYCNWRAREVVKRRHTTPEGSEI